MKKLLFFLLIPIVGFSQDETALKQAFIDSISQYEYVHSGIKFIVIERDISNKRGDSVMNEVWYSEPYTPTNAQYEYIEQIQWSNYDTLYTPLRQFVKDYYYDFTVEYKQKVEIQVLKKVQENKYELFKKWYDYCTEHNLSNSISWEVGDSILNK